MSRAACSVSDRRCLFGTHRDRDGSERRDVCPRVSFEPSTRSSDAAGTADPMAGSDWNCGRTPFCATKVAIERSCAARARKGVMRIRTGIIQLSCLLCLQTGLVQAQGVSTPTPPGSRTVSAPAMLYVEVIPGPSKLDVEAVRGAIEQELGIATTQVRTAQTFGRVQVEGVAGSGVVVRYESADGATKLERRVALPVDANRRALVISWVTGNLVRNEAAEILSGMKGRSTSSGRATTDANATPSANTATDANATSASADVTATEQTTKEKSSSDASHTAAESHVTARPIAISRRKFRVADPQSPEPDLGPIRVGQVSLFSSTLAFPQDGPSHRYALSLGGLYNHIGGLNGFGVGWGVDRIEYGARGFQVSALWTDGSDHTGMLAAGIGTRGRGDLRGMEVAGLLNWRSGCVVGVQVAGAWTSAARSCKGSSAGSQRSPMRSMTGTQVSGVAAVVGGSFEGAQLAGATAIATEASHGWQLAGAFAYAGLGFDGAQTSGAANVVVGEMYGLQLSGAVNYTKSRLVGAQMTGALNMAEDVTGLQLGSVNLARDVKGVQLGIVNVARKNQGLAIGLFNWSEGARVQPTYFFQTPGYHNVGYRSLSGHSIGSISFGYDPSKEYARTHFSVGARTTLDRFAFGIETGYGWVLEHMNSGPTDRAHELDLVGTVSVEVVRNLVTLYGGGGAALPVAGVVPVEPRGLAQVGISIL